MFGNKKGSEIYSDDTVENIHLLEILLKKKKKSKKYIISVVYYRNVSF
jgi:hypothetical protein